MTEPKFPNVEVQLSGEDGNAFMIISRVRCALKKAGASEEQVEEYSNEAMSGDYDNVIATTMRWVEVL